jgi:hypothetical protein
MVFLGLLILIILIGMIIFFGLKKSKTKLQEHQSIEPEESLPKFKFDD